MVFWGLYWGPPILGNYHLESRSCSSAVHEMQDQAESLDDEEEKSGGGKNFEGPSLNVAGAYRGQGLES